MALDLLAFRCDAFNPSPSGSTRNIMTAKEWNKHLLIVDDDELILDLIKRQLKDEGYNILLASSGETALQLVKTHQVGVIVSDQSMPEMDGIAFLSKVRQNDDEVVLIMLTGNGTLENALDAINQLKVFSYITKPCSASVMKSTIRSAFKHYEMTSIYRMTLKRTYQLNEHLNKENARLTEYVKEMEKNLEKLQGVQS
jgi:DNA-binding NtrC family response regulator